MSAEELAERFSRMFPREPKPQGVEDAAAAAAAESPHPVRVMDHAASGIHLEAVIKPEDVVGAAKLFDQEGFALDAVTGVDWIAENQMEVVYDYFHPTNGLRAAVRARIPRDKAEVETIGGIFPGAYWHERETHDFFGIRFLGHPNLTPLLLPEDAIYHPLRKDFKGE
jgi:NADH-quinone oxidoreductase subunit C